MSRLPKFLQTILVLLIVLPTALVASTTYQQIVLVPICRRYGEAAGWNFRYYTSGGRVNAPQCVYQVEDAANQTPIEKSIKFYEAPFSYGEKILFLLDRFVILGGVMLGGFFVILFQNKKQTRYKKRLRVEKQK